MQKGKKFLALVFAIAAAAVCAMTASAFPGQMYCVKDNAQVLEEPKKDSELLQYLYLGQEVLAFEKSANGKWICILCPAYGNDGQKEGWVRAASLSDVLPQSLCSHSYTDWYMESQATCTQKGTKARYCVICGKTQRKSTPALGHAYGNWVTYQPATCTQEGRQYARCERCGHEEWWTTKKLPHEFSDWAVTTPATCTQKGERVRTCRVCGIQQRKGVKKLPHAYGNATVTKKPTCSSEGRQTRTCATCGHVKKETIEKLPHDFEWKVVKEATDHSAGVRRNTCRVCGYVEQEVSFDPEGTIRRGAQGEQVREMQRLLADQSYLSYDGADGIFGGGTEQAVAKFQEDHGLQADGVCWPQTMRKLEHDFGPWEVTKPCERDEAGERTRKCKECGYEQHEAIEPEPTLKRGERSERVRLAQQMLKGVGSDPGACDGIYGPMLDAAFETFAGKEKIESTQGQILPAGIDALTRAWLGTYGKDALKGEGSTDSPTDLVLSVVMLDDGGEDEEGMATYSWTVTNAGGEGCSLVAVLAVYGDTQNFKKDSIVAVLDGGALEANRGNSANGSMRLGLNWGKGSIRFRALGMTEDGSKAWLSNEEKL